jgi:hypothetical protein
MSAVDCGLRVNHNERRDVHDLGQFLDRAVVADVVAVPVVDTQHRCPVEDDLLDTRTVPVLHHHGTSVRHPVVVQRLARTELSSAMTTPRASNLPVAAARQIRLLEYLVDVGRSTPNQYVPLPDWAGDPQSEAYAAAVRDLHLFENGGYLRTSQGLGGPPQVRVLPAGVARVEEIRALRSNRRRERNKDARDAVLDWLYDCHLADVEYPEMADFSTSPFGQFYGEPFEEAEVQRAVKWLADLGYFAGTATADGVIGLPTITAKGIRMAESDRSVNDPEPHLAPSIVTQVTGNYNAVQAASPGASMQVTTTITDDHRQQTIELAKAIEQAVPVLSPDAAQVAVALREAVAPGQSDPVLLKRALERAKTTLSTGAGDLIGKLILAGFGGLLAHYGIPTS